MSQRHSTNKKLLIGVLRWIVELERSDIFAEVSMIYLQSELPCIEYLQKVMHIFAYLKVHTNSESVFDPSEIILTNLNFQVRIGLILFIIVSRVNYGRF